MMDRPESQSESNGFSPFVAACFILNYMIGTGFLALPWAFDRAGLLLSSITMVFVCAIGIITVDYEIIALARANILRHYDSLGENQRLIKSSSSYGISEHRPTNDYEYIEEIESCNHPVLISSESYAVNELYRIFMGAKVFRFYTLCISLNMFGELSAYACVFASALSDSLPIFDEFDENYGAYILVFSAIVIPFSMMELNEQVYIQIFLSGCRIFMFVIMILSSLFASLNGELNRNSTPIFDEQHVAATANLLDLNGLKQMFTIVVFATIVQQSVPELAATISDRRQIGGVFKLVFILVGVFYIVMACSVAWFFGDNVEQSSNLNWTEFQLESSFFGDFLSYYVVLFPALDVVSAFPLNSVVLGNSIMTAAAGAAHDSAYMQNRILRSMFRLFACIPPLLTAYFYRSFGVITSYAGLAGLAIAFPLPALLFIKSSSLLREKGLPTATFYDRFGSDVPSAVFILVFGVASIVFCAYYLLLVHV